VTDRRDADRRAEERRAFREQDGRRDEANNRRRGIRRYLAPALLLAVPLLVGLGWRTAVVAPRRATEARAAEVLGRVVELTARTSLPMLMLAGGPPPLPLPPGDPVPAPVKKDRTLLDDVHDRLSPSLRAAPTLAVVPATLGPARFLLGNERGARKAWESLLAVGLVDDRAIARVGLGVIAIRVATRQEDPRDRAFALAEALRHLDAVALHENVGRAARFDRGVALALLDRSDDARAATTELDAGLQETLNAWIDGGAPPATLMEEVK